MKWLNAWTLRLHDVGVKCWQTREIHEGSTHHLPSSSLTLKVQTDLNRPMNIYEWWILMNEKIDGEMAPNCCLEPQIGKPAIWKGCTLIFSLALWNLSTEKVCLAKGSTCWLYCRGSDAFKLRGASPKVKWWTVWDTLVKAGLMSRSFDFPTWEGEVFSNAKGIWRSSKRSNMMKYLLMIMSWWFSYDDNRKIIMQHLSASAHTITRLGSNIPAWKCKVPGTRATSTMPGLDSRFGGLLPASMTPSSSIWRSVAYSRCLLRSY